MGRTSRSQYTREQLRENMRWNANSTRDTADEMAAMYGGCDDPSHPWMPVGDEQPFRDWIDFTERVCRPLVDADGNDEAEQAAMLLYRKASPMFIATALAMALYRIENTP